jgi:hypothetical protein
MTQPYDEGGSGRAHGRSAARGPRAKLGGGGSARRAHDAGFP